MLKTGNPLHDFNRWDDEQYELQKCLPICTECGKYIDDEYYFVVNDHIYCPECIEAGKRYNDL